MIGNWRWENKNESIGKLRTIREGKPIAFKGLLQIATKYNTDSNKVKQNHHSHITKLNFKSYRRSFFLLSFSHREL